MAKTRNVAEFGSKEHRKRISEGLKAHYRGGSKPAAAGGAKKPHRVAKIERDVSKPIPPEEWGARRVSKPAAKPAAAKEFGTVVEFHGSRFVPHSSTSEPVKVKVKRKLSRAHKIKLRENAAKARAARAAKIAGRAKAERRAAREAGRGSVSAKFTPKVKPAAKRPVGRPRKEVKTEVKAEPKRRPGRPRKEVAPAKRPVGRPRKAKKAYDPSKDKGLLISFPKAEPKRKVGRPRKEVKAPAAKVHNPKKVSPLAGMKAPPVKANNVKIPHGSVKVKTKIMNTPTARRPAVIVNKTSGKEIGGGVKRVRRAFR